MTFLETPIEKLPKVGPKYLARLKDLGIKTVKDLIWHFPSRYEDFSQVTPISEALQAEHKTAVNIIGEVIDIEVRQLWRGRLRSITEAIIEDDTGNIKAVWFNQPFVADQLLLGTKVSLAGKITISKGQRSLSNPSYERVSSLKPEAWSLTPNLIHTGRLVPIYRETRGITSKYLRFLIKSLVTQIKDIPEPLSDEILDKYELPILSEALYSIHFPESDHEADMARRRLAFDDLLLFQLRALLDRRHMESLAALKIKFDKDLIAKFVSSLPFKLTDDQRLAAYEILQDIERAFPMNRLLNGDVGSGKTVVALIAAYQAMNEGFQVVFMAPTEILAKQHFATAKRIFGDKRQETRDKFRMKIGLLTGSEARQWPVDATEEEKISKKLMQSKIAKGEINLIIGTHAVIQKEVKFKNLALVVVDEQHRFGIKQRKALLRGSTLIDTQIDADNSELLHEGLTYKIRGILFDVYNKLGSGHKEIIYHLAILEELKSKKLNFDTEKLIAIKYGDKKIGDYKPDIIVESKVILELKAIPFIGKTEEKQLWSYLKGSEYKVALLANFGNSELQIKRVVYDTARNPRESASNPRQSAQKGWIPHFLSMTATPIPRTLALTIYGDLDISLLKEKPKGRLEIITQVVSDKEHNAAHDFIRSEIQGGRQVFVICPRIDPSRINADSTQISADKISVDQRHNLRKSALSQKRLMWQDVKAVTQEFERLSKEIFKEFKVAMLHGKMKADEKNKIMSDFRDKKHDVLVSTSVIEVGVDIPNASVMMIRSADRFGLAQLHQFRGRVGRGEHQSYCLLFSESDHAGQRLRALEKTSSGFDLAEIDLKLRGPGEFIGTNQSGLPDLSMTSLTNLTLIKNARHEAKQLLKEDPSLKKYPLLLSRLSQMQKMVHFE